jgi:hypothetical protein
VPDGRRSRLRERKEKKGDRDEEKDKKRKRDKDRCFVNTQHCQKKINSYFVTANTCIAKFVLVKLL